MNERIESIIYCEGYHDRAFWDGWLLHLGCKSLKPGRGVALLDPFGDPVRGGHYAYQTASGNFVRVAHTEGKTNTLRHVRTRLGERLTKPIHRIVVNVDSDLNADGTPNNAITLSRQSIVDMVRSIDNGATEVDRSITIDDGGTTIQLITWSVADEHTDLLPKQQTLERLVCASIISAYPARGSHVKQWIMGRPDPIGPEEKAHAWSHMAGWYAESGCDYFYKGLWADELVATHLELRLRESGDWDVAQNVTT